MAESGEDSSKTSRFLSSNKARKSDLIDSRNAPNTRKGTKTWVKLLLDYILDKKVAKTIEEVDNTDLPELLESFYADVRKKEAIPSSKKKGKNVKEVIEPYKNSSLKVIRAGINRYFKDKRGINIISDQRFIWCNQLFQGVMKEGKKAGYGSISLKEPITPEDLARLNDYFSRYMAPDPVVLQCYVQFNLMYFLCRRGCENLTTMHRETFDVSTHN